MPVSQYEKYVRQFNPVKFDAKQWVRIAKDAGMKYIVITSKHHDGFGMYRSDLTDWCIKSTPFQRDPLQELAAECRKAGLKMCFYHSIMDWHHPDWGTRRQYNDKATGEPNMDRYTEFMKGQLKELLTRYGPIGIMWFDGEWESPWTHERGVDVYNFVRGLQPEIIVNNRVGKGRSGMQGMDKGQGVGDYGTPEQEIPPTGFGPGVAWESCMTMNTHWGYNRHDQRWKSTENLVRNLIDCASKGGNYLLNVGPTAEGLIPGPSVARLAEIGAWMKVNREAIYGTTASPFKRLDWGRCTQKPSGSGTTLYLHVFNWPKDGTLLVPGLKNKVQSAAILGQRGKLKTVAETAGVVISVSASAPNALSSTVVLKIKGRPEVEELPIMPGADGSLRLVAAEALLHGGLRQQNSGGHDNIGYWTDSKDWVEWRFKLATAGAFEVGAEIAALGAGKFTVAVADQTLNGTAPLTGDYAKFQRADLGVMNLPAGEVSVAVKPVAEGWRPMNLKALILTPKK
jgi:alpha-L-fucosidase